MITAVKITSEDLVCYSKVSLINAMLELNEVVIPIDDILK
jgi:hypothetical protein